MAGVLFECRMAEKYNMKLLFTVPFADYFQQKIHDSENRGLIGRMQGLEVRTLS